MAKRNRIKCLKCEEIIESKTRHDWVSCSCAAVFVDGGNDYRRMGGEAGNIGVEQADGTWKSLRDVESDRSAREAPGMPDGSPFEVNPESVQSAERDISAATEPAGIHEALLRAFVDPLVMEGMTHGVFIPADSISRLYESVIKDVITRMLKPDFSDEIQHEMVARYKKEVQADG